MVGLVNTAATSGSANSSRTRWSRCAHSSTLPSSRAISKTAFAYRLAAAVATRDLLDRTLDQLLMPGSVKGFADDFFGGCHNQGGDLSASGLQRAFTLRLDFSSGRLRDAFGILFGLFSHVLAHLLTGLVCRVDDLLRGLAGLLEPVL